MANEFSKEERVAFDELLEGFDAALVLSKKVATVPTSGVGMERSNDTTLRPVPYILTSQNRTMGTAVTNQDATQLSVPASLGYGKTVPFSMDAKELRDALQENRLGDAAKQRLASDIDKAVRDVVSLQGTLVQSVASAATGYDDVALVDAMMMEQGVAMGSRCLGLSPRDYNNMAGNLAERSTMTGKPTTAYEKAFVGVVAGFDTLKTDSALTIAQKGAGSITIDTTGSQVEYEPKATSTAATGETGNVDNRYQTVTVSATTGVAAGDSFTIADVESVHHITKDATGQLKTFRVIEVINGTTMKISPAIVGGGGGTDAELQYQNVSVTATSATAAITFLNTQTAQVNPFWRQESIELLNGSYAVPSGAGAAVLRATTDQGIEVVMTKQFDNSTFETQFTLDVLFGVANVNPEMNGILVFGQS